MSPLKLIRLMHVLVLVASCKNINKEASKLLNYTYKAWDASFDYLIPAEYI